MICRFIGVHHLNGTYSIKVPTEPGLILQAACMVVAVPRASPTIKAIVPPKVMTVFGSSSFIVTDLMAERYLLFAMASSRFDCHGSLHPFYDTYPECSRRCLACPDLDWTYQGSQCAAAIYNSSAPTPCCSVPERPWRFYHFDIWECVQTQCDGTKNPANEGLAQEAFRQWGNYCAEERGQPLYEYWSGTHFGTRLKMEGFCECKPHVSEGRLLMARLETLNRSPRSRWPSPGTTAGASSPPGISPSSPPSRQASDRRHPLEACRCRWYRARGPSDV